MSTIEAGCFNTDGGSARLIPEALEANAESGRYIEAALAQLQQQLQTGNDLIPQLARRGIFIWPEVGGTVMGVHAKKEWGRNYETRLMATPLGTGVDIVMQWQNGSSGYDAYFPAGSVPSFELIKTIDDIASLEESMILAAETERLNAERVRAWHTVNGTSHPAYRTHRAAS